MRFLNVETLRGEPISAGDFVLRPQIRRIRIGGRGQWIAGSLYPVALQVEGPAGVQTIKIRDYTRIFIVGLAVFVLLQLLRRLL
jgi:hypothetical protein